MRWHDAMRCSLEFDALYFVKYLQDGFTSTHAWDEMMRCIQSPKSPIPDLSSMHSNDVSCPYEHLLIGDFGVWLHCSLVFDALLFCKIFARWVYKKTRMTRSMIWQDAMRCSLVFDALLFCKIFARWVYLNTRTRWHDDAEHEIPDLFRSCGHETPFSDQKGASKIGDSVLCDDALLFSFWMDAFV